MLIIMYFASYPGYTLAIGKEDVKGRREPDG